MMFSNGTEFIEFDSKNCLMCKKHKIVANCPIELKILECQFVDYEEQKNIFPFGSMKAVDYPCRFICKEIELKDEFKHLQNIYDEEFNKE